MTTGVFARSISFDVGKAQRFYKSENDARKAPYYHLKFERFRISRLEVTGVGGVITSRHLYNNIIYIITL